MADRKNNCENKRLRPLATYSSKIIKAGALIGDTKTLLSCWDVTATVTYDTATGAVIHRSTMHLGLKKNF